MTLYIRSYVRNLPCVHRMERLPGGYHLIVLTPWIRAGMCMDCGGTGQVLDAMARHVPCEFCQGRGRNERARMYVCVELQTDPWGRVQEWSARVWEPLHGIVPFSWDLEKLERILNEAGILCSTLVEGVPPDPADFPELSGADDPLLEDGDEAIWKAFLMRMEKLFQMDGEGAEEEDDEGEAEGDPPRFT